jgi:uncharacterized membrane protein YhaH (DUF805 family)
MVRGALPAKVWVLSGSHSDSPVFMGDSMGFFEAVRSVFSKYAEFNGRARRSEYWWFYLFQLLTLMVLFLIEGAIGSPFVLTGIAMLAMIIPSLAVAVRRLHDSNKSGWLYLIAFVPFGGIVLLIFFVLDSTPGDNQYGPNPKTLTDPTVFA